MKDVLMAWHREAYGALLAATVMPDHVHALIRLGKRLQVGRVVARWKAQALRKSNYVGAWQRDFWEHRIRSRESWEEYGLYMLLNPYRAGLIAPNLSWSGWCCPVPAEFAFMSALTSAGAPPVEWLNFPEGKFEDLQTGE